MVRLTVHQVPDHQSDDYNRRPVVHGPLLVAGGNPAPLKGLVRIGVTLRRKQKTEPLTVGEPGPCCWALRRC